MNNEFRSIADIRKWFMQFRLVVYTKDRDMDLELMEGEIKEAYEAGLLEQNDYQKALLIIKQEKRMQN
ncbi:YqgQ family protein [Salibacterium aidingense]